MSLRKQLTSIAYYSGPLYGVFFAGGFGTAGIVLLEKNPLAVILLILSIVMIHASFNLMDKITRINWEINQDLFNGKKENWEQKGAVQNES